MGRDVIVVTGASTGLGRLAAEALALAGHTVYASMQDIVGRNASQVDAVGCFAKDNGVDLRTVELDVQSPVTWCSGRPRRFAATTGRLVRHQCGRHAASQSGRTAAHASPAAGPARVGIQQQLSGWHAAGAFEIHHQRPCDLPPTQGRSPFRPTPMRGRCPTTHPPRCRHRRRGQDRVRLCTHVGEGPGEQSGMAPMRGGAPATEQPCLRQDERTCTHRRQTPDAGSGWAPM
jgi:hypothetical protein